MTTEDPLAQDQMVAAKKHYNDKPVWLSNARQVQFVWSRNPSLAPVQTPYTYRGMADLIFRGCLYKKSNLREVHNWMAEHDIKYWAYECPYRITLPDGSKVCGVDNDGFVNFWFSSDEDIVMFRLFWAGHMVNEYGQSM